MEIDTSEVDVNPSSNPDSLKLRPFVTARVSEIIALTRESSRAGSRNKLIFQHVPKHMRRRAVSHNPKRLPKRLRAIHIAQVRKGSSKAIKKPKRRRKHYRKRAKDKLLEYNRRQLRNPLWLESHVWHAKRFHMKPMWGKRIPERPTAKCFRSLVKAAKNQTIMQDVSFLSCFQITGPKQVLVDTMTSLLPASHNEFGRSVSQTINIPNQEHIGYLVSSATAKFLGTVRYLWTDESDGDIVESAKLVIWFHPTLFAYLVDELVSVFQLVKLENYSDQILPADPNQDELKYGWKTLPNGTWTNTSTQVVLRDMTGLINRIRLTGLKTLPVLKDLLKVGEFKLSLKDSEEQEGSSTKEEHERIWKSITKIVDMRNNTVLPLNVIDPRLKLPAKRRRVRAVATVVKNATETKDETRDFESLYKVKMTSALWNENVCRSLLRAKVSDEEMSRRRSQNLIPGTSIADDKNPDVVPIALVFRSGLSNKSRTSSFVGVDLIVPIGWLMPFWIALSYRCVRAYGMEFSDYLTFEQDPFLLDVSTSRSFPVDSIVSLEQTQKLEKPKIRKYFGRPPAKRPNLLKLGCAFPFSVDWSRFIRFTSKGNEKGEVRIVRKWEDKRLIKEWLRKRKPEKVAVDDSHLIPVEVTLLSGTVDECAAICIPTLEDFAALAAKQQRETHFVENPFFDSNEHKRATLTKVHNKKMASLRRKRKAARKAANPKSFNLESRLKELDSSSESEYFNREINKLWLVSEIEKTLESQNREVMGFTTYGHFSFLRGKCAAMGYVTVGQLKKLVQFQNDSKCRSKGLFVLVRSWNSTLTYHWAKLNYLIE